VFFCNILLRYAQPPVPKGQTSGSGAGDVGPAHDFVFQGAISSVFQSHLKRYVELEEQELRGSMARALKVLVSCFDFVRSNPRKPPAPCRHQSHVLLQDENWEGVDMGDGIAVFSSAQAVFGSVKKM
jgi:hypothetical protein